MDTSCLLNVYLEYIMNGVMVVLSKQVTHYDPRLSFLYYNDTPSPHQEGTPICYLGL